MADVCTLVIVTTMNTIGCASAPHCGPEIDGRILCVPMAPMACPIPPPSYSCKRADGTEYTWTDGGKR